MSTDRLPSGAGRSQPYSRPWALLWVAAGASLWGTDTLLRRPLTSVLTSSQVVLSEHLILIAVLLPSFWRARPEWRSLRPLQWAAVLGIAWGGSALGTICFTEAIKIGNPTTAVFLQKSQPFFSALLARALLRESLGRRFWICLLLALAGAYLVSFGDRLGKPPLDAAHFSAALLALSAAALWGSSTVLGRFVLNSVSFLTLTGLRIFAAAPFLVILAWWRSALVVTSLSLNARQGISLVLLALIPGLAALLIYYRGLGRTRASLAAVAELSFPATATLLNWVFLGARVSAIQIAGFALLWGVILNLERRAP
ncbi:MAG: DMT family transporter [Acidobacteria bacterium]|nr:DMT family transporter [Acidobacteriota bacterium]